VSSSAGTLKQPSTGGISSKSKRRVWLLVPVLIFAISAAVTEPPFMGDSRDYATEIAAIKNHQEPVAKLWESGHPLWRPLGYIGAPGFLKLIPDRVAWTPILKICYGLMLVNLACGAMAALLIFDLSRRLAGNAAALIATILFVWGDAVLAYSQSGMPYVTGLSILILGVWWQLTARSEGWLAVAGPAALFGIAALFWLPYAIAIPAACCARRFVQVPGAGAQRMPWNRVLLSATVAGAVMAVGMGLTAILAGVRSVPDGLAWLTAAQHGLHQNRQAVRAITGSSRLFIELGRDGVYLKRFLFHDPYHPVNASSLIRYSLWKVALFYAFLVCALALAWLSKTGRRALAPLLLAGGLALPAAIAVFEPSSPERFLPVLPFLLLAVVASWPDKRSRHGITAVALTGVCLFAALLPVLNWPAFAERSSALHRRVSERLKGFRANAGPDDAIITVMPTEPLEDVDLLVFDPLNRPKGTRLVWAVNPMSAEAARWPVRLARSVEENWADGRNLWVEKTALGAQPADSLLWVEGDNPDLHWRDVPIFFRSLEFDRDIGGAEGFLRISRSQNNQERLAVMATVRP